MLKNKIKKLSSILLVIFFNNSISGTVNDLVNQTSIVKKKTDNSIVAKRIILKSFIKGIWKMTDIYHNNPYNKKEYFDEVKYKLAETLSLLIIDETLPIKNLTKNQKIAESLIPIIISSFIVYDYKKNFANTKIFEKQNYHQLIRTTIVKLVIKTIKSNFFLDNENRCYNLTQYLILYPFAVIDPNNFNFNINVATKNIINEVVKTVIKSKNLNLGKTLNVKHRKKVIAKTIIILLEPFIKELFK